MMDSKKAIKLLQNLQIGSVVTTVCADSSQQRKFYIHEDNVKQIAELIQQQDKMLELAIYKLSACCCGFIKDCGMDDEQTCEDCWRKYLQSEVSK